jgi:uncharacterized protein (DUF305 family)
MIKPTTSPNRRLKLLVAAAVLFAAGPSLAQRAAQNPAMPGMSGNSSAGSPMVQAMDKMDKGMAAAPMTGNTDQDFVAMMIPHHQGAVDMAKVELSSGKDPQLHRLAQNIIASQERQIGEMKNWQAKHPAKSR